MMLRLSSIIVVVFGAAMWVNAQTPDSAEDVRFSAVDIFIDSGDLPLAAYQFELMVEAGDVKMVGVEGGEHPAFNKKRPPYYDPKALHGEGRIIIADYTLDENMPTGKSRVARVMVQISGDVSPAYSVNLIVAGTDDGQPIEATAIVAEVTHP